jgi:hypothetical protein
LNAFVAHVLLELRENTQPEYCVYRKGGHYYSIDLIDVDMNIGRPQNKTKKNLAKKGLLKHLSIQTTNKTKHTNSENIPIRSAPAGLTNNAEYSTITSNERATLPGLNSLIG